MASVAVSYFSSAATASRSGHDTNEDGGRVHRGCRGPHPIVGLLSCNTMASEKINHGGGKQQGKGTARHGSIHFVATKTERAHTCPLVRSCGFSFPLWPVALRDKGLPGARAQRYRSAIHRLYDREAYRVRTAAFHGKHRCS